MAALSTRRRLTLFALLSVAGIIAVWAIAAWNLHVVAVNGPLFVRIADGKDLVSDVLPPPLYIIEANLLCLQALEAPAEELEALEARGKRLSEEFALRQRFWAGRLPEGALRDTILVEARSTAEEFFRLRDERFVPLLRAGQRDDARALVTGPMRELYERHRASIDRVVLLANREIAATAKDAESVLMRGWLATLFVAVSAVVLVAMVAVRQLLLLREREAAEARHREDEERFRLVMVHAPDAILVCDLDAAWHIIDANDNACALLACDHAWLLAATMTALYSPLHVTGGTIDRDMAADTATLLSGKPVERDCTVRRHGDGGERLCDMRLSLFRQQGRRLVRASLLDITDRRAMEVARRVSEKRFGELFEQAPIAIDISRAGTCIYTNSATARLFGYESPAAMRSRPVLERFAPEVRDEIMTRIQRRSAGIDEPNEYDSIGIRQDGTRFAMHVVVGVVELDDGVAALGFVTDISEQKRTEAVLRESEERYRTLFDNAPDAIILSDVASEGRIIAANPQACDLFGCSREHLIGLRPVDVSAERQPDGTVTEQAIALHESALREGQQLEREWTIRRIDDGRDRVCEMRLVRLVIGGRTVIRASFLDISERKRVEAIAIAAESDAVVGRLAGRVAHEVNNPLEAIKVYIEPLRRRVKDLPEVDQGLAVIDQQVDRIARLVLTLLGFVRQRTIHRQRAGLRDVITTVVELLKPRFDKQEKRFEITLADSLAAGAIDVDAVQQVLINLLENAQVAVANGSGWVGLTARSSDGWLEVVIEDNGPGLGADPEHLFKPFVSTKANGTGLGLAVARRICEAHHGQLTGGNRLGGGARFDVRLRVDLPADDGALPGGEVTF